MGYLQQIEKFQYKNFTSFYVYVYTCVFYHSYLLCYETFHSKLLYTNSLELFISFFLNWRMRNSYIYSHSYILLILNITWFMFVYKYKYLQCLFSLRKGLLFRWSMFSISEWVQWKLTIGFWYFSRFRRLYGLSFIFKNDIDSIHTFFFFLLYMVR